MKRFTLSAEDEWAMRPPGTPDQLQQRRRRAVQLLQAGRPMSAVARQVQASVSCWTDNPCTTYGRDQLFVVMKPDFLEFSILWTLARLAKVIHRQFGIRYHPSHVWRLLTARGWQCQPLELSETEKPWMKTRYTTWRLARRPR